MSDFFSELNRNLFFEGISEEEIVTLVDFNSCKVNNYEKGEIIAVEEDECTSLGLILSGVVQIVRIHSSGKQIVLKKLNGGDVFGEALVFSKEEEYPATVMALSNCSIVFIKKTEILRLCSINQKVLENFLSLLSEKIIMLNSKIKNISLKSIKHKVVNYILEQEKLQRRKNIHLGDNKEEIASSLGILRPSLSRELIILKDAKLIDYNRKEIIILDKEKLEEILFN